MANFRVIETNKLAVTNSRRNSSNLASPNSSNLASPNSSNLASNSSSKCPQQDNCAKGTIFERW
jgi:hypothetical protein